MSKVLTWGGGGATPKGRMRSESIGRVNILKVIDWIKFVKLNGELIKILFSYG